MRWSFGRLGKLCATWSGRTPSRSHAHYYGGSIPWAKIGDLSTPDSVVHDTEEHITDAGLAAIGNQRFRRGTLLLAMYGSVGKLAVAGQDMAANQAILGIWPHDASTLDIRYLRWWIMHIQPKLLQDARGVTQANISKTIVDDLEVPLPPIDEQRRIAAILDKADVIRRKRREALMLTERLLRSTFLEMFGDSSVHRLTTVEAMAQPESSAIRTGPFGSQLLHSEFVDTGIPVLGIDNVVANEFRWGKPRFIPAQKYAELRRYTVKPCDVLISIMGTCGRCAIAPTDIPLAINTKHLCCITLDAGRCLPEFLHSYFLYHPIAQGHLRSRAKGAVMDGLNMEIIKELPIPEIPVVRQERYRTFVHAHRESKANQTGQRDAADALFESLTHRAFTGQL